MGAGGHMTATEREAQDQEPRRRQLVHRAPSEKPPFTLGQLKKAIPPHCFQRSVIRSFSYLVSDLVIVSALVYLAVYHIPNLPAPLRQVAWAMYWFWQGAVCTGIWVIGHECGHHAFSDYQLLDDVVGLISHSALMVPYFSWKYSHRRHHANTCSLETDEVFIPKSKSTLPWFSNKYLNNPPGRLLTIFITLTMGFPMYLVFNVSGRKYLRFASHFDPYSPIYSDRERAQVLISDAGLMAVGYALYKLSVAFSLGWVVRVYGVPLLMVNGWFTVITYLHHTHRSLPHFDSSEWEWLRGALATMDRDFGFLNKVFHYVTITHVMHHIFPTVPHYHAMEANEAIKPILGDYYQIDHTPVYKAIWREARECVYVEPDQERKGVYWYKNKL